MDMSFLEVDRRATMACPGPREDQAAALWDILGLDTGCWILFQWNVKERFSSVSLRTLAPSAASWKPLPSESESLRTGLSSAPCYQIPEMEDPSVKRPPLSLICLVQEGRREGRRGVCETTSWKQNLALGKSQRQKADVTEDSFHDFCTPEGRTHWGDFQRKDRRVFMSNQKYKYPSIGSLLVVQWWRLWAPDARGLVSIPGQGTGFHKPQQKISHAATEDLVQPDKLIN